MIRYQRRSGHHSLPYSPGRAALLAEHASYPRAWTPNFEAWSVKGSLTRDRLPVDMEATKARLGYGPHRGAGRSGERELLDSTWRGTS
jgi:hypothetical protein